MPRVHGIALLLAFVLAPILSEDVGWWQMGLVIGAITAIGYLISVIRAKEKPIDPGERRPGIREGIAAVFSYSTFRWYLGANLAKEYVFVILAATLPLWREYALGINGETETFLGTLGAGDAEAVILGLTFVLAIPFLIISLVLQMADHSAPHTYLASTRAQAESSLLETEGYPAVTATWHRAPGRPLLLVYGHYDLQPAENDEEWTRPPFDPVVEDGFIWGRGASDDKGQFMALRNGLSAYIQTGTPLPVNVTVLIEGEEEINSVHLPDLLESEDERLSCDAVVAADSLMLDRDHPVLLISVRGHVFVELTVTGPHTDLHSGTFGGSVGNPINVLAGMLAALQDGTTRKVLIPGFYDDVVELDQAERERINSSPITDELGIALTGAPEVAGESGYTLAERVGSRPTLDIVGITGGYTAAGKKSVQSATAHAKISMRLVPQQSVDDIEEKLRRFLLDLAPSSVSVVITDQKGSGSPPAAMDPRSPWIGAAAAAYELSHGSAPLLLHGGGSEPMVGLFQERFAVPVVMPGFGLPDDNNHAPNEKMDLDLFHKGAEWMVAYLEKLPQFLSMSDWRLGACRQYAYTCCS